MTICCTEEHYLATLQVHDDDNVGYGGDYGDDDDDDDCDGGDCDNVTLMTMQNHTLHMGALSRGFAPESLCGRQKETLCDFFFLPALNHQSNNADLTF